MRSRHRRKRSLRALQIEVTSRCTRSCALCPRSALSDSWCEGDLCQDLWSRLEPDLSLARHVHLQGWGEPLLHPGLRQMAHAAKLAGCSVGITTNGDLLEQAAGWLVEQRVDIVTISVAGEPGTHRRLRGGSDLERVLSDAGRLAAISRDKVQLSYLLTRENAGELPSTLERAARAGVKEVFVTHLDCTPSAELLARAAFDENGLLSGVVDLLDEAAAVARRHRLRLRAPSAHLQDLLTCALDPTRLAFVAWDGRVGPCVNLLMPLRAEDGIPRAGFSGHSVVAPVCYGNLEATRLDEILAGPAREGFVGPFEERLAAERRFAGSITTGFGVEALRQVEQADRQRGEDLEASPFPDACAGCHKAYGW